MKVLICAPTLTGREPYLRNMMRGYRERTPDATVVFSTPKDLRSCGEGWNAAASLGLQAHPDAQYIHFSNDDVVPACGWLEPLVEAHGRGGFIGCSRMEPVGVHLGFEPAPDMPAMAPPIAPTQSRYSYYYADVKQPWGDWQPVDHGSLCFCSVWSWRNVIKSFLPIHFGTDKWFYQRARDYGYAIVTRSSSVIFNYAAQIGRSRDDWTEQDYLDFDLNIAYPMYLSGALRPSDRHPLRNTPEGLKAARDWRAKNVL